MRKAFNTPDFNFLQCFVFYAMALAIEGRIFSKFTGTPYGQKRVRS